LAIVLLLGGCGTGGSSDGFNTLPGSSVLVAGVTSVKLTSLGGGLHAFPPAGAACDPAQWTYTVGFADQTLASTTCLVTGDASDPASYVPGGGPITLTPDQWSAVHDAVAAVTVSGKTNCGADADSRNLTVVKASDSFVYGDDFYACLGKYSAFVSFDRLNDLQQVLQSIPAP
jgi:hypothetical protein